ncbi:MAG: hypothetical protein RRZ64_00225 [Rikenellaceae bacterium]
MAFEKGNNIGKQFSSDNQPKKNGRKPSLYKQLKDLTGKRVEYEMSKEDYFKVIRYLMERTPGELKKILEDAKDEEKGTTPVWVINIISAINSDIRYGRTSTMDMIFDRLFGRSTQPIEGEINGQVNSEVNMNFTALTTDELLKYNELLEKINGKK